MRVEISFLGFKSFCYVLLLLQLLWICCAAEDGNPVVSVGEGNLKGIVLKSRSGRNYFGFLGIHYAAKPERFEVARPPVSWEGTRDANEFGPDCPQFFFPTTDVIGDENCLVLNIYSPELTGSKPVMVFFHGGAFMFGNPSGYGAKYFMDKDVVLVTVNYRLGVFGFLSTQDEVLQGNYGLKDQVAALKYIQANIAKFGGDAESVTIFGESAGAASVNYHLISPMSRGLFIRAISQSGSVLNPWALQRNPQANARKLADIFDCPLNKGKKGSKALKKCLKSKTTKEIVDSQRNFVKLISGDPISPFAPSVEQVSPEAAEKSPVFLSDLPYKLLSEEKHKDKLNLNVSWIAGLVENEGLLIHAGVALNDNSERGMKIRRALNEDRDTVFPTTLSFEDSVHRANWDSVSDKIYTFYFGDRSIGPETASETTNMFSDRYFNHGVRNAAKLFAKQNALAVYTYILTFKGKFSFSEYYGATPGYQGVTHLDDLPYLFNMTFSTVQPPEFQNEDDKDLLNFSENLLELWTSFAKTGIPEIAADSNNDNKWTAIGKEDQEPKWYKIDRERKLIDAPFASRMKFWDDLPELMEMQREDNKYNKEKDEL